MLTSSCYRKTTPVNFVRKVLLKEKRKLHCMELQYFFGEDQEFSQSKLENWRIAILNQRQFVRLLENALIKRE